MPGYLVGEESRKLHLPHRAVRLRRSKEYLSLHLGQRPFYGDAPPQQVDRVESQASRFAPPETGVGSHEYEGPILRGYHVGQIIDLWGCEEPALVGP